MAPSCLPLPHARTAFHRLGPAFIAGIAAIAVGGCALGRGHSTAQAAPARPTPPAPAAVSLTPVGRFNVTAPSVNVPALAPEELSGIAWIEGDHYIAIGDDHATMYRLRIDLDRDTGRIEQVHFGEAIPLLGEDGVAIPDTLGSDREGIEFDPETRTVCISNEHTGADQSRPSIACHRLEDGRLTRLIRTDGQDMMRVFSMQRLNGGFESLTRRPDNGEVWTANEMPLSIDGEPPSDSTGSVVRLQLLDRSLKPVAQYAYPLDSYRQKIALPPQFRGYAVNGLSELLALPGGGLLALERAFAGDSSGLPNLRIRIYQIDLQGATELSARGPGAGLRRASYAPVKKRLLWEQNFGLTNSNFEGMTLGPPLRNGDLPLILVADNNGGYDEAFLSFRLSGLVPREASAPQR